MKPITVLLAEDHTIVRKGLRSLLSQTQGIKVIGEAENGREAVKLVEKHHPELVVMDISMPLLNGLEATRQIKKRFPKTQVLILTVHDNEEYLFEIIKAGASGYIVKKAALEELLMAVQAVSKGETFFSPTVSTKIIKKLLKKKETLEQEPPHSYLTEREREVLQLIAEGYSNKEIAEILFISVKTVEAHRSHIMEKLDLHKAADLTKYAIEHRIIETDKK
ncbi:MAG: response regulator [Candidatus Aminicenantes bacterium]|nr:response regulator [Candidatus Aminicenantes bacterium]